MPKQIKKRKIDQLDPKSRGFLAGLLIAVLVLSGSSTSAFAWGSEGHDIVARIAMRLLTPEAKAQITTILEPTQEKFLGVTLWADGIRGSEPGKRPETPHWHFVDIPLGTSYNEARDCAETPNGSCAISALVMFQDILADRKKGYFKRNFNRYEALKFIIHFSGDIHQPLHCITDRRDNPNGDNGGNAKEVIWFSSSRATTNLHSVWDAGILRRNIQNQSGANAVAAYAGFLFNSLSDQQKNQARPQTSSSPSVVSRQTITGWARDAHDIAEGAYSDIGSPNAQGRYSLGPSYYNAHRSQVDEQLKHAGIRLARILNENLR